jgi:mRNA interferase MazF
MADRAPHRGEIWQARLDPVRGHEQGGTRPTLVISADLLNAGPAQIIVVCPLTTRFRAIPSHVPVAPPEGGLRSTSYVICEQLRAISAERLGARLGELTPETMAAIDDRLRILLDL